MQKYWTVFKISFQQEFAYPTNFVFWRIRNVIQILLIFFLWDTVFTDPNRSVFGYDKAKILTYVFGIVVVRSIVLSIRSIDVAGEISRGDLSNYLLKPVSYLKYWLTRDISSKALNLLFGIGEVIILFILLRPPFFFQANLSYFGLFIVSLIAAVVIYFFLVFIFSMFTFIQPEQAWGSMFLLFIFTELFGGALFPIDILPATFQKILFALPFPYLLFMPLEIYLGKFSLSQSLVYVGISLAWVIVLGYITNFLWRKGLRHYRAEGK